MAKFSRTQIKLQQITGSFGNATGKIRDDVPVAANLGAIVAQDLTGSLGHLASAIKRLNGGTAFSSQAAGEINQAVKITDGGGLTIGAGGDEFSITESSDDVFVKALKSDKDMIFHVNDGGADTEIFRLDGDVSALKMAQGKPIQFGDSGESITGDGNDITVASGRHIKLSPTTDLQLGAGLIDTSTQDTDIKVRATQENALRFTDGTANFIQLDSRTAGDGRQVNVIQSASFSSDVSIAGDLVVNGSTVTVNASELVVEDKNIVVGKGSANNTAIRGAGLNFEVNATQDAGFIRVGSTDASIFELQAPANANTLTIDMDASGEIEFGAAKKLTVGGDLNITADSAINQDVRTSATPTFAGLTSAGAIDLNGNLDASTQATDLLLKDNEAAALAVKEAGNDYLRFRTTDNSERVELLQTLSLEGDKKLRFRDDATFLQSQKAGTGLLLSGSALVISGANIAAAGTAGQIHLHEKAGNGDGKTVLRVNDSLAADTLFQFPANNGTQGFFLQVDGQGVTSWADVGGNLQSKQIKVVSAHDGVIPGGTAFRLNSGSLSNAAPFVREDLNLTQIGDANVANGVDIYVNGQLLVSGGNPASSDAVLAEADYHLLAVGPQTEIKFGFDLENEDIILIKAR